MAIKSLLIKLLGFLCLCAIIWFIGPLFSFAGYKPLGTTTNRQLLILAIILFALGKRALTWWRAHQANKKLAASIAADADIGGSAADADLATLSHDLNEALTTLKSEAKAGIYELPWYIIIGAPGTGKTTALANSGMRFPLAERSGKASIQGVGGTRHCDWWFSDEAIFLDTAGRYTTQDSDAETDNAAWLGFLKMLRKSRDRRPINGVLVTVSTSSLLEASPGERDRLLHSLRQRLQELQTELGVNPPVYLLVTKADLLQGFREFFDDLGQRDRQQVLGFTFEQVDQTPPIEAFKTHFENMVSRLNSRVLWRMRGERDRLRNNDIFSFPQQLTALGKPLTEFCEALFKPSRYELTPVVRGVYFTSGTQEGTPIDRLVGNYARSLGGPASAAIPSGQARSYFLHDLIKEVVLPEQEMVGTNKKLEARKRWLQRGVITAAAASIVLGIVLWTTSYVRNQVLINDFETAINDYQTLIDSPDGDPRGSEALLNRLDAAAKPFLLLQPLNADTPLLMGMGLYQGRALAKSAQGLYQAELQKYLLPTMQYLLADFLNRGNEDPQLTYEALKAYLMLSRPQYRDASLIETWMLFEWQRLYPSDSKTQGRFQQHVVALSSFDYRATEEDANLVAKARGDLAQFSLATLLYGRIKQDFSYTENSTVDLLASAGPYSADIFSAETDQPATLSRLFTREGYKQEFGPQLDNIEAIAEKEYWVLSDAKTELSEVEIDALRTEIRQLYLGDYNQTWDVTLARIDVNAFGSLAGATRLLKILANNNSPLLLLTNKIVEETSLARGLSAAGVSTKTLANEAAERLGRMLGTQKQEAIEETLLGPERVVDKHFQGVHQFTQNGDGGASPAQDTADLIGEIYKQFDLLDSGLLTDKEAKLAGLFDSEKILQLQLQAKNSAQPVADWLNQIAVNSRQAVFEELRADINKAWAADVLPFCQRAADGRYPFVASSSRDISLVDFGKLLGPSGLIDQFQRDKLNKFIATKGQRWSWRSFPGLTTTFSTQALAQLKRADRIEKAFFADGGDSAKISYSLTPIYLDANIRKIQIELGSNTIRYRHGPARAYPATWPDDSSDGRTRFEYEDDSGELIAKSYKGPWSLFHFLDLTTRDNAASSDTARVTLDFKGRRSTWDVRGPGVENPFADKLLSGFSCPESF